MMRIAVTKLGLKTSTRLLQLSRLGNSRHYTASIPTRSPLDPVPPPLASPGLSALDSVVFPSVFPFKVIAEHSPPLTVEILHKAQELLLAGAEKRETKGEEEGATEGAVVVPHKVTVKGRYMSLTLSPKLQHASQVCRVCVHVCDIYCYAHSYYSAAEVD